MWALTCWVLCGAAGAAELPLPEGAEFTPPWETRLFLDEQRAVSEADAAIFAVADDPEVGRCLVVGPWLAGKWSARVQYTEAFPCEPTELRGLYRTEGLLPLAAGGRIEHFGADGRRRAMVPFGLAATDEWTPFSVRIDKFPPRSESLQVAFGLLSHTAGRVFFAKLELLPAGPHPLAGMPPPEIRRPAPPGGFEATGFYRVEQAGEAWWLVDPQGRPWYSLAVDVPSPRRDDDLPAKADAYVSQIRGWGFNSIGGWTSASTYQRYNDALRAEGKPTVPLFKVINFHDPGKFGEFDMLTDRWGDRKAGEHGFPDPFDPRFEQVALRKAEYWTGPVADSPDFVAYFVDNEMSFDGLHRYVWSEHCSAVLMEHLRAKYESVAALNERWGTEFESWEALREARPEPPLAGGPMFDDLVEFERVLVKRFIDISIASVRAHDKNHLIASNRYNMGGLAEWMRTIDLCSAYDIVACNLYPQNQEAGVGRAGLQVLREVARRTGRPVLIGEWSVPAMDSGLYEERKHALDWSFPQTVPTQEVRAAQAARTAADYYNEPYMVGAHWFIYRDFDTRQREANRGLVRGDGTPYQELTSALTSIHSTIARHFGAE